MGRPRLPCLACFAALACGNGAARADVETSPRGWSDLADEHPATGVQLLLLQLGCNVREPREHNGVGQLALWSARTRYFHGLVQASLDHNANTTTVAALQVALANYSYEWYGLVQLGAHNMIGREMYAVAQVGLYNEVDGLHFGLLQLGVANDMRFGRRSWAVAPLQIGLYNHRAMPTYSLGQLGLVNRLGHGTVHAPWRIGLVNRVEDTAVTLLEAGAVNWSRRAYTGLAVGLVNRAELFHGGAQVGVVNTSDDLAGVQIGLFNRAGRLRGLQLGLVNRSEEGGLPWSVALNVGW